VLFYPFCGAEEAVFFGVPGAEDAGVVLILRAKRKRGKGGLYMLRLGFQPDSRSFLMALVNSTRMAEPELGSPVPPVCVIRG
jgi:hypothetical protein